MNRSLVALALVSATVAACSSGGGSGGGGGGGNSLTGSIGGTSMDVKSALIVPVDPVGNSSFALVVLSDKPNICDEAKLGNFTPSSTWFEIELGMASTTGGSYSAATAPGVYRVNSPTNGYALSAFFQFDATCQAPAPAIASAGSANVTSFTVDGTRGTGDFDFGADHVHATFDVQPCPELLTISICQ